MMLVHCRGLTGHPWIYSHLCFIPAAPCRQRENHCYIFYLPKSLITTSFSKSDYVLASSLASISNKNETQMSSQPSSGVKC